MNDDKNFLFSEFFQVAFILVGLLILGYSIGTPWLFFSLGLLVYLYHQFRQLTRLIQWLSSHELEIPPEADGLWGEVFRHLYRIQRHNRQRQEKLVQYLKRYKKSTEAMPDATIILKHNWTIEWFNSKSLDYLGLKKKQDIGKILTHCIPNSNLLDFLDAHKKKTFKKDNPATLSMLSPDKNKVLSIQLIPYGDKFLLIARDVTQMERLKSIRKVFVSNVSHELRTPLTVISGYLETFQEYFQDQPQINDSFKLMHQQTHRMTSIVQDLLLLSQVENNEDYKLKKEYINMPELLVLLKKEAEVLSSGKHTILMETDDNVKRLRGDLKELQSAFSNLISNAIRYTPDDGIITIRCYKKKKKIVFSVQDTGEGIAPHHLNHLTERFYRVDVGRSRTTGGTGLGLAIVKHVMTHHKGQLLITSKLNKGSTFECVFPASMG